MGANTDSPQLLPQPYLPLKIIPNHQSPITNHRSPLTDCLMTLTSLILLTYNNLHYTRQCLDSILVHTPLNQIEIIVVDNASQDDTPHYLQKLAGVYPQIHPILNATNLGFSAGINLGAANARGEYLVFLNNDVIVTEGWLSGLLAHL